jgi:hypothetical protein
MNTKYLAKEIKLLVEEFGETSKENNDKLVEGILALVAENNPELYMTQVSNSMMRDFT